MSVIIKIKCQNEVHRVPLQKENLSFESVVKSINSVHPVGNITIKYMDDDNDLCTLCPNTFSDFLCHGSERDGKKTLKVEVFEVATDKCLVDPAPSRTPSQELQVIDAGNQENPSAVSPNMGIAQTTNVITKGGFGKGLCGKGFFCKGKGKGQALWAGCHRGHHGHGDLRDHQHHHHSMVDVRMLKFSLIQLYKNGLLDADSFSALLLSVLPQLMTLVAEHPDKVNRKLDKFPEMTSVVDKLCALVASIEGLQHCEVSMCGWRDKLISPSEALLQLLPALMALPFDAQVAFATELYTSQEEALRTKIHTHLMHHPWIPTVPLVHEGVTCDGCGIAPLIGARFKCRNCPDYDLCTRCFLKKTSIHGHCGAQDFGVHDFQSMTFPEHLAPCVAALKGKGKGKGKGKAHALWWLAPHDGSVQCTVKLSP